MRQALIPVDEDGLEPQVCVIEVRRGLSDPVYTFTSLVSHQHPIRQRPAGPLTLLTAAGQGWAQYSSWQWPRHRKQSSVQAIPLPACVHSLTEDCASKSSGTHLPLSLENVS